MMRFGLQAQSGMSLVAVMVAIGIGTLIVAVGFRHLDNVMLTQKLLEQRGDLASLRNHITSKMSCPRSIFAMGTCTFGNPIKIMATDGNVLIDTLATPTKLFNYSLRASCVQCTSCTNGKRFLIEVFLPAKPKSPKANTWIDLYDAIPPACVVP